MHQRGRNFEETQWSLILRARDGNSGISREAISRLCNVYWFPIYSYILHKGYSREQSQDLTQDFFVLFLEKDFVNSVTQGRGKFRSFLLAATNHFLTDEWRRKQSQKRGGDKTFVSLDFTKGDQLYAEMASDNLSPEKIFDRNWARTVLARALNRLRGEYGRAGKERIFDVLHLVLSEPNARLGYEKLAEELELSPGATRTAAYRLRKRYAEMLKDEISQTLDDPSNAETELKYLLEALG